MSRYESLIGGLLAGISFLCGLSYAYYKETPLIAYERKIEGDSKQYLIIESLKSKHLMVRESNNSPFKHLKNNGKITEDLEKRILSKNSDFEQN